MNNIKKLAKKNNLYIIEDCAHAIGTKYKNKHVGTFGDTGCFSFYPSKNITTFEGGMIITNSKKLSNNLRMSRNHGITRTLKDRYSKQYPWNYDIKEPGYNSKDIPKDLIQVFDWSSMIAKYDRLLKFYEYFQYQFILINEF